jgi:hypothetical protein
MKALRQTAVIPSANPAPQPAAQGGKTTPVPLSETALKQVVGGVAPKSINTPQHTW